MTAPDLNALLADIETLVSCESPSHDHRALAHSAASVAAVGLRLLGVGPEHLVTDGCPHLRWRFGDGPSRVLLLGHHDTVWPVGTLRTHPYSVRDGILRGPGCFDMKAGVVMALHAAAALPDRDGLTILITGDEEIGSPGSRELIEETARGCEAVLVLEASAEGGALKCRRKGVSLYRIEVEGRAAHAGLEPDKGINAGMELAHHVLATAALSDTTRGTTVVPTALTAGTTANTVPATAQLAVDVRAWDRTEQERVDQAVRALRPVLSGARLHIVGGVNRPPLDAAASTDLFALADSLAADLHIEPLSAASVGGASDGNFTAGLGVPTLDGLGAVGGGAHADTEHVVVAELPPRTTLLTALTQTLLARHRPAADTGQRTGHPACGPSATRRASAQERKR
ncbi:M20 family metallopeptidase [Streptomyces sp. NPDC102467]|uniref:M20 family metallopeptidase n=1 Tax=Streptomyces sp. NPDC102467 TaxID=3366179 RepID=UPI003815F76A